MKNLFLFLMLLPEIIFAQRDTCSCAAEFAKLTEKLEANYIAYHLTRNETGQAYEAAKKEYQIKAGQTPLNNCTAMLQDFLRFFNDGHLFAVEYPEYAETKLSEFKNEIRSQLFDVNKLDVSDNSGLEGYWTDGTSVFAIIRYKDSSDELAAVIVNGTDQSKNGELKFRVKKSGDNWSGVYYSNSYTPRYTNIKGYRDNTLLGIWGGILWARLAGKTSPLYKPEQPTFQQINVQTVCVTLPSFLIEKKDFDAFLKLHDKQIKGAENLIVDIRGNAGGNGIYFDLLSYYYERPAASTKGFAVSSDDNITYFERFAKSSKKNPYLQVVNDMIQNKGAVVSGPAFDLLKMKARKSKIRNVVILTDKGNMSAAESFILYSKGVSTKVITMGESTGGVIDYNNVNMVKLNCKEQGIYFGYPTYSMANDVHLGKGYNKTGIIPDVFIPAEIKDKVVFVTSWLKNKK